MNDSYIKPNTHMAQLLQALRAGDLYPSQIQERWPHGVNHHLRDLINRGYVHLVGPRYSQVYRITEAGRVNCPERRAA